MLPTQIQMQHSFHVAPYPLLFILRILLSRSVYRLWVPASLTCTRNTSYILDLLFRVLMCPHGDPTSLHLHTALHVPV